MTYITGINRIVYRSVGFVTGLTVTGYFWSPTSVKSALQTFTEVEEGLYYCDFDFTASGAWMGLFYENAVVKASGVFRTAAETSVAAVLAAIQSLNDISTSEVNTEIVDALTTDTYDEPGKENPGVDISLADKISYLYKVWRNKKELNSTTNKRLLYNDAGDIVDQERDLTDNGTVFTEGEVAEGS